MPGEPSLDLGVLGGGLSSGLLQAPASRRGIDGLLTIDLLDPLLAKHRFKIS